MDLIGKKIHRLLVLEKLPDSFDKGYKIAWWKVRCDCGNIKSIRQNQLTGANPTKSCGCFYKETRATCSKPRLPLGEHAFNSLINSYKTRAKKKNMAFELSREDFRTITSQSCFYCGVEPYKLFKPDWEGHASDRGKIRRKIFNGGYIFNGIDRLDSSIGYLPSNCVACCEICNKAKRDLSVGDFIEWIRRIAKHQLSLSQLHQMPRS